MLGPGFAPHSVIFGHFSKKVTFWREKNVTTAKTGPMTPKFFPLIRRVPVSVNFCGLKKKFVGSDFELSPDYRPKKAFFFFFFKKNGYF